MSTLSALWMWMVGVLVLGGSLAKDFDNPSLGVKYTHKGYFTAASSHYIHTIRIPTLTQYDNNSNIISFLDYSFLNCDEGSILLKRMDNESIQYFCEQTRVWRNVLQQEVLDFASNQINYQIVLQTTFEDKSAEIYRQSRRHARFISLLTGAASLLSRVLDSYEKIVIAKQIRHLSQNQKIVFSNQERIMRYMQSTAEHNKDMHTRLVSKMHHYKAQIDKLTRQVIWNAAGIRDNNRKRKVIETMMKLMNYVYTIHRPIMAKVTAENQKRIDAFQTIAEGKLPISLVSTHDLSQILSRAQGQLATYNAKLAVVDIELLYTMRIVTAQ